MKLDLSDGLSNNSDFSSDSQNSQMSTADFMTSMGNGILLTPTSFLTLDGLNSGVPTRTTPTLTPTTLRNIEQTFIELQCAEAERHQNEAGFVPPLVHSIGNNQYISASDIDLHSSKSNSWQSQSSSDSNRPTPPVTPASVSEVPTTTRRNMGGRKPNKNLALTPEEEERRKVRRERNKMAAARCRKRRVDHTNLLLEEVDGLEQKKQALQNEIQQLQTDKEELEFILDSHQACCRLQGTGVANSRPASPPDVKPAVYFSMENGKKPTMEIHSRVKTELNDDIFSLPSAKRVMPLLSSTIPISRPSRPSSLNVGATFPCNKSAEEIAGMSLTTPSTGIPFNFESMMVGGTGLTPVAAPMIPSCSTQQRNLPPNVDLSSPDANGPPKLVSL